MKLIIEVEVQEYGGEEEALEALEQMRTTLIAVVSLADLAVGTFTTSEITKDD